MDTQKVIDDFVKEQIDLIDIEYKEECEEYKNLDIEKHSSYLERNGLMIRSSFIVSKTTEYGKYIVDFHIDSGEKSKHSRLVISTGDTINVWVVNDEGKKHFTHGVVTNVDEDSIGVSFDAVSLYAWDEFEEGYTFCIVKTVSDVTTQRMKDAMKNLKKLEYTRSAVLVDILFGNGELKSSPLHPRILNSTGEIKFINSRLHEGQKRAVQFALQQKNFAIIHGPPGTGKTTTLVEIILQLVLIGNKVLLCAPSNIAVDTILEKLLAFKARVVRLGHPARMLDSIKDYSLNAALSHGSNAEILKDVKKEIYETERQIKTSKELSLKKGLRREVKDLKREFQMRQKKVQRDALVGANIVLATLASAHKDSPLKDVPEEHFDVVIIDECSQGLEAACWIVIPRAPKLILAGDHHQLPPTLRSREAEGRLDVTLMERALQKLGEPCYNLLTNQFRMNVEIMSWVSHTMYDDKLTADETVAKHLLKDLPGVKETEETGTSLLLINTAGFDLHETQHDEKGSIANEGEACIVSQVARKLVDAGVDCQSIAVITPYSLQVSCIEVMLSDLRDIEIRTVDGFQGREKEAVILSFVRSNKNREIGFVTDKRRLNVAVSRARRLLVVVTDSYTVGCDKHIASLLDHMEKHGVVNFAQDYMTALNDVCAPRSTTKRDEMPSQKTKTRNKGKTVNVKVTLPPRSESNLDVTGEDKQVVNQWVEKLKSIFVNEQVNTYELPASLTSYERRLVHEAADILQYSHYSVEYGDKRHIVVGRKLPKKEKLNNEKVGVLDDANNVNVGDEIIEEVHEKSNSRNRKKHHNKQKDCVENTELLNNSKIVDFSSIRTRPKHFIDNAVRCESDATGASGSTKDKETEDFDAVVAEFAKLNSSCSMPNCKVSCKLMSHVCIFCKKQFCFNHAQAEVHGCGEAAKRAARHNFKHPEPKQMNEREKKAATNKLKKKLSQMADSRKVQTKKK